MTFKKNSLNNISKKIKIIILIIIIILSLSTIIYNQNFSTVKTVNKVSLMFVESSNSIFIGSDIKIKKDTGISFKESNIFEETAKRIDFDRIIKEYDLLDFKIGPNSINFIVEDLINVNEFDDKKYIEDFARQNDEILSRLTGTINSNANRLLIPSVETMYQELIYLNQQMVRINSLYEQSGNQERIDLIKLEEKKYSSYSPIHLKNFEDSKNYEEFAKFYSIEFKIIKTYNKQSREYNLIRYIDLIIVIIFLIVINISINLFLKKFKNKLF